MKLFAFLPAQSLLPLYRVAFAPTIACECNANDYCLNCGILPISFYVVVAILTSKWRVKKRVAAVYLPHDLFIFHRFRGLLTFVLILHKCTNICVRVDVYAQAIIGSLVHFPFGDCLLRLKGSILAIVSTVLRLFCVMWSDV